MSGASSTSFVGAVTGYQDGATTIVGTGALNAHIQAYLDAPFTADGTATYSAPTQAFAVGTCSLFGFGSTATWESMSFSGGRSDIAGASQSGFDAIYNLTINASSSSDMHIGGVVTHPFTSDGVADTALLGHKLRAAFCYSTGSSLLSMNASRVRQTDLSIAGQAEVIAAAKSLAGGATTIAGVATGSMYAGSVNYGSVSVQGQASSSLASSSFAVQSATITGTAGVFGTLGGIRTEAFSAAGSSSIEGGLRTLLQGEAQSTGLTGFVDFTSSYRLQATRYETVYLVQAEPPVVHIALDDDAAFFALDDDELYLSSVQETLAILRRDDCTYILPEHTQRAEAQWN